MSSPHINSLIVLSWNCNSLKNKINELRDFVSRHPDIDIILLQEIKTTHCSIKISGYKLYHNPRPGSTHGGTAIYIKHHIPHHTVQHTNYTGLDHSEIVVQLPQINISFISLYAKHSPHFPVNDLTQLLSNNTYCFVAGDYNSHNRRWNCLKTTRRGNSLHNLITHLQLSLHAPNIPTHIGHGNARPSIIDFAISKNLTFPVTTTVINDLSSDHYPVSFKIDFVNPPSPPPSAAVDWCKFKNILQNSDLIFPDINNTDDIDNAVNNFQNLITNAQQQATFHYVKPNNSFTLPNYIHNICKQRNHIRRLFQNSRDLSLKPIINRLNNKIKNLIYKEKQKSWDNFLSSLSPEDNSLWLIKKKLNNNYTPIPPLTAFNTTAYTDQDKAEILARSYAEQFSPNPYLASPNHYFEVHETVQNFLSNQHNDPLPEIQPKVISDIIKKLKNRKAPGIDKISNIAIKNLPCNCILYLTKLTNTILHYSYFPKPWKTSVISPIPKPLCNLQDPTNFRPISLLPSLSKVVERVIRAQLHDILDNNDILIPEQFGFRTKHSSLHQLLRVVEFLSESLNTNTPAAAIFLDVAKAFDKVWHEGLIYKLIKLGINARLILLIHSYLSDRTFCVRINNILSTLYRIQAGILQGSVLGPTLFNIFFNDIPRTLRTYLALYADDTAMYASAPYAYTLYKILQEHIDKFTHWCAQWRVRLKEQKTTAVYFCKKLTYPNRITVNNTTIPWTNHCKYLGVYLDRRLTWKQHFLTTRGKVASISQALSPLLKGKTLSIKNKLLLYNACILSVLTYGCPIWGFACKTNMKKLSGIHNRHLRSIRNGCRYLRNTTIRRDLATTSLKKRISHLAKNFYKSVYNLPNQIIAELPDYEVSNPANRKRPKYSTLLSDED